MAAASPFPPPASRNAPCPCGSGLRYKACHGAVAAPAPSELDTLLPAALAAQQAGRWDEAAAGYERALALAPAHFDALHMLGVVHFQRGDFEQALALIDRALAVQPGMPGAVFNRRLVQHNLALRSAEEEIGRLLLPRLARFVSAAPRADEADATPVHLVLATAAATPQAGALAARATRHANVQRWRETGRPIHRDAATWPTDDAPDGFVAIDAAAGRCPTRGHVVMVGAERPPSAWWPRCTPASVTLVVAEDRASFVAARIRELAGDGARRITLAYADAAQARRCRLPGHVLEGVR